MNREELIELVKTIQTVCNQRTGEILSEEEHHALLLKFKKNIKHHGGTDLIYYPELAGLPENPTIDEIVDLAMKNTESTFYL